MQYPVNNIFQTIQGEATHTGTPSTFIRLQGCSVGCAWCDTKETWPDDNRSPHTAAQLVIECMKNQARHVVITGGEPCQFDLRPLCETLEQAGYKVQVETSGTYEVMVSDKTWVTVSPKEGMKLPLVAQALLRADEIKYPVGRLADIGSLELLLKDIPNKPIWLQPLSQSQKATDLCIAKATQNGWKVSFQIHKYIGIE